MKHKWIRLSAVMAVLLLSGAGSRAWAQTRVNVTYVNGSTPTEKEGTAMVADGYKHTKWCVDEPEKMPYFAILDAKREVTLGGYSLTTGDDTNAYPGRNPSAWNVYGSNDGKTWKVIDSMKWDRLMSDENAQEYHYAIQPAKAYRYYKFEFLKMVEGTRIQLSEISLYTQ